MHEHPLVDGNEWLGLLMQHEDYDMRAIGLRILETRELYTNDVFDFEEMNLKAMAVIVVTGMLLVVTSAQWRWLYWFVLV